MEDHYTQLRNLLKAGKWKEADQETAKKMREVMGRQKEVWLRDEDIEQFPCTDLRTIDQLWVKYSKGKFGFSIQKKIYLDCGAKLDGGYPGDKIWNEFGDRVGWREKSEWIFYREVTFDTFALEGHLPSVIGLVRAVSFVSIRVIDPDPYKPLAEIGAGGHIPSLSLRLVNCSI